MTNLKKNKKGFTLVELIVVIAIIAIIAGITATVVVSSLNNAKKKTAAIKGQELLKSVAKAFTNNNMYNDDGTYKSDQITAMFATDAFKQQIANVADGEHNIVVDIKDDAVFEGRGPHVSSTDLRMKDDKTVAITYVASEKLGGSTEGDDPNRKVQKLNIKFTVKDGAVVGTPTVTNL